MEPRLTVLTLVVADLERSVAFYRDGLGWPTAGIIGSEFEHGAVCFFDLAGGVNLALWPRASLAKDAEIGSAPRPGRSCRWATTSGRMPRWIRRTCAPSPPARPRSARPTRPSGVDTAPTSLTPTATFGNSCPTPT